MGRSSQVISSTDVKTVALTKTVGEYESTNSRNGVRDKIFIMIIFITFVVVEALFSCFVVCVTVLGFTCLKNCEMIGKRTISRYSRTKLDQAANTRILTKPPECPVCIILK